MHSNKHLTDDFAHDALFYKQIGDAYTAFAATPQGEAAASKSGISVFGNENLATKIILFVGFHKNILDTIFYQDGYSGGIEDATENDPDAFSLPLNRWQDHKLNQFHNQGGYDLFAYDDDKGDVFYIGRKYKNIGNSEDFIYIRYKDNYTNEDKWKRFIPVGYTERTDMEVYQAYAKGLSAFGDACTVTLYVGIFTFSAAMVAIEVIGFTVIEGSIASIYNTIVNNGVRLVYRAKDGVMKTLNYVYRLAQPHIQKALAELATEAGMKKYLLKNVLNYSWEFIKQYTSNFILAKEKFIQAQKAYSEQPTAANNIALEAARNETTMETLLKKTDLFDIAMETDVGIFNFPDAKKFTMPSGTLKNCIKELFKYGIKEILKRGILKEAIKQVGDFTYKTKEDFDIKEDHWGLVFLEYNKDPQKNATEIQKRVIDFTSSVLFEELKSAAAAGLLGSFNGNVDDILKASVDVIINYVADFEFELLKTHYLLMFEQSQTLPKK